MNQDGVVLLHGIFRTRWSMWRLERALKRQGYATLNLSYPSRRFTLQELVEWLHPHVAAFAPHVQGRLHFIGHSMGGLLIRAYLHKYRPAQLGKVVMLGTPNAGSEVADFVQHWWLFKKLFGPAGQQLITRQDAFAYVFGPVDYELGIIAGNRTIDPLSSHIIGKPNDGKVSIESTKLAGMTDHVVIAAEHVFMPSSARAREQALAFLTHGRFKR